MQVVAQVVRDMVIELRKLLTSLYTSPIIFNSFSYLCFPASATLSAATSLYYRRKDLGQRILGMSRDVTNETGKNKLK